MLYDILTNLISITIISVVVLVMVMAIRRWIRDLRKTTTKKSWSHLSQLPNETFKTYALRMGFPERYIPELLTMHGILKPDQITDTFMTYLSETINKRPSILGKISTNQLNQEWVNIHGYSRDKFIPAVVMTSTDWHFFVRVPLLWEKLSGRLPFIQKSVLETMLDTTTTFNIDNYTGFLADELNKQFG